MFLLGNSSQKQRSKPPQNGYQQWGRDAVKGFHYWGNSLSNTNDMMWSNWMVPNRGTSKKYQHKNGQKITQNTTLGESDSVKTILCIWTTRISCKVFKYWNMQADWQTIWLKNLTEVENTKFTLVEERVGICEL